MPKELLPDTIWKNFDCKFKYTYAYNTHKCCTEDFEKPQVLRLSGSIWQRIKTFRVGRLRSGKQAAQQNSGQIKCDFYVKICDTVNEII